MTEELIFTVALSSGDFKSELRVPLSKIATSKDFIIERWLDLMQTGLRVGAEKLEAIIPAPTTGETP